MKKPISKPKTTPTKPKPAVPKKNNKEIKLKAKHTKKNKNITKEDGPEMTAPVDEKPQFIGKKRLPPTNSNTLIKLPWSVSYHRELQSISFVVIPLIESFSHKAIINKFQQCFENSMG